MNILKKYYLTFPLLFALLSLSACFVYSGKIPRFIHLFNTSLRTLANAVMNSDTGGLKNVKGTPDDAPGDCGSPLFT